MLAAACVSGMLLDLEGRDSLYHQDCVRSMILHKPQIQQWAQNSPENLRKKVIFLALATAKVSLDVFTMSDVLPQTYVASF